MQGHSGANLVPVVASNRWDAVPAGAARRPCLPAAERFCDVPVTSHGRTPADVLQVWDGGICRAA